jgi:hypothetical protein
MRYDTEEESDRRARKQALVVFILGVIIGALIW